MLVNRATGKLIQWSRYTSAEGVNDNKKILAQIVKDSLLSKPQNWLFNVSPNSCKLQDQLFNSLAPRICGCNSKLVIFKCIVAIDYLTIFQWSACQGTPIVDEWVNVGSYNDWLLSGNKLLSSAVDNPKFMGHPPDHPWWKTGLPKSFVGCNTKICMFSI